MMNFNSLHSRFGGAILFLSIVAACGSSSGGSGGGAANAPVSLGGAGNFVILAKAGISNTPTSAITGNIGVSPIGYAAITGFALTPTAPSASTVYATSAQVTGQVFASDYHGNADSTKTMLTAAVSDMELAYTDAAGRAPGTTELGGGNIAGMTLSPGVYKWSSPLLIPTDVTLSGSSTDGWIFEVGQGLTMGPGARVVLAGGAQAKNIFWQVAGAVTLNTTAHLEGIVLCQTAITLNTGATVNGRLLAQMAVTLDGNTVVEP
jgi:hypothetical protein